jgi:hypothetical protein
MKFYDVEMEPDNTAPSLTVIEPMPSNIDPQMKVLDTTSEFEGLDVLEDGIPVHLNPIIDSVPAPAADDVPRKLKVPLLEVSI